MSHPRLSLALEGAEARPAGRWLVIGPGVGTDLSDLPAEDIVVVQGFRPDHDALAARGYTVLPDLKMAEGGFVAAVIFLPRARLAGRALVAGAVARLTHGAPVWIDGQKTDGVETMLRDIRVRVPLTASISKAHGRIFAFAATPAFDDWTEAEMRPAPGFVTRPGVFSADRIDHGSALLAAALPPGLKGRVADLGAGWGWLSAAVLTHPGVTELHLVEADHAALDCARANIDDPRARFHWADATGFRPDRRFDIVVMNPPFHTGRAAEPALGAAFIAAAARMLTPSGRLFMVANRHLPYEAILTRQFRDVAEIGGDGGFKLLSAARPTEPPRPGR